MKILVTGGAGFIGSHIADAYLNEGHEVVIVDDLSRGQKENINPQAKFYRMNICNPQLKEVFTKEKPQVVNHHAAQIETTRSLTDPVLDARINILGTINILQNCVEYKTKKIIFASSGAIYGEKEKLPILETSMVNPLSPYGISKLWGEYYCSYYGRTYGLRYIILRYANVYGPRQEPYGEAGVIAIFIQKMLKGKQPIINGDGEQTRDYVYIEDVVKANLLALREINGVFNMGAGKETTVNRIFQQLKEITGSQVREMHGPSKEGEPRRITLDYSKALRSFGWKPEVSLIDGLEKTVEWFKNRRAPHL